MLELTRTDPDRAYTGGYSIFRDLVHRVRREQAQVAGRRCADVPIRFEGLPAKYLQVDWGEVRGFPFTQQPPARQYFLACRLKHSRAGALWAAWVRFTAAMRQETLFRGLVDCFVALDWVPWVLVFDNVKIMTSGRDGAGQPIWTTGRLQLAGSSASTRMLPRGRPATPRGQLYGDRQVAGKGGEGEFPRWA